MLGCLTFYSLYLRGIYPVSAFKKHTSDMHVGFNHPIPGPRIQVVEGKDFAISPFYSLLFTVPGNTKKKKKMLAGHMSKEE